MKLYKRALNDLLNMLNADVVISTGGRELEFITSLADHSIKIGELHTIRDSFRNFNLLENKGIPYNLVAKYYRYKIDKKIKELSSLVLLSEKDAQSWSKIRTSKIIPNSIPFQTTKFSNCSNKKVISVGRFSYEKRFDLLIKAWKIVNASTKLGDFVKPFPFKYICFLKNPNAPPHAVIPPRFVPSRMPAKLAG